MTQGNHNAPTFSFNNIRTLLYLQQQGCKSIKVKMCVKPALINDLFIMHASKSEHFKLHLCITGGAQCDCMNVLQKLIFS